MHRLKNLRTIVKHAQEHGLDDHVIAVNLNGTPRLTLHHSDDNGFRSWVLSLDNPLITLGHRGDSVTVVGEVPGSGISVCISMSSAYLKIGATKELAESAGAREVVAA